MNTKHNIYVLNKKRKLERIRAEYPDAEILDVTSTSPYHSIQILSPFYPHGNIPIPFSDGQTATCVEAVWQGLKVFQEEGISLDTFKNDTMKNLKRTVRKYGKPLGHRKGINGDELLDYPDARMLIYIPTYKWVLDNIPEVHHVVNRLKEHIKEKDLVFLDYNTNTNPFDFSKPISHAGLLKLYIEGNYPDPNCDYRIIADEQTADRKFKTTNGRKTKESSREGSSSSKSANAKRKNVRIEDPTLF